MKYTERIMGSDREKEFAILQEMEEKYDSKDASYFNKVMKNEPSLVVRVHAVTVLSEIGDESSVLVLADVLKKDPSTLIRHEAAFSLGQLGLKSAVPYLVDAALNDPSEIVRHESAAALGAIGDERARDALNKASKDPSDEVRGSAIASLFNLDFMLHSAKREKEDAEKLAAKIQEKRKMDSRSKKKMPHP
ncbi:MAG: HEAT repeat domain-containing protein [Thaumarchaeota archaeon]|nr:HEAT repeat domain-containing protein [Nitrososphaerota archaeon]